MLFLVVIDFGPQRSLIILPAMMPLLTY